MATIHELAMRMNDFASNIDSKIEQAVMLVDYQLLDLNRDQLTKRQVAADDSPMPDYSAGWAKAKGLSNWNLYNSGATQKSLLLTVKGSEYLIYPRYKRNMDKLEVRGFDTSRFFGVAPSNKTKAYSITNKAIAAKLKAEVFK